jgi:hypothetical protein
MKKKMIPTLLLALAGVGLTLSCNNNPSDKEVKDAREDVQEERQDVKEAVKDANQEC